MVKAMDCSLEVSVFELQSYYNVRFGTNTLEKGMNPVSLSYGLNSITNILLKG